MIVNRSNLFGGLLSLFFCLLAIVECLEVGLLTVSLYKATKDGALIDWYIIPDDKEFEYCELVYSPAADKEQQRISSDLIIERHTIDLVNLAFNVTYDFHMVCYDSSNKSYVSNTISFTTGVEDPKMGYVSRIREIPYFGETPYSISLEIDKSQSSNVILGAICGIVGFLIINVTLVLAVKRLSQWHVRRRRIIHLEDQEYNGFEYLHNVD